MTTEHDDLSTFQDEYLDYLEGARREPPILEELKGEQRRAAEDFVNSITAARGVDPYASRPSIEQLLASRHQVSDPAPDFGELLQDHLRQAVDPRASVMPDVASVAIGLTSTLVIHARGMRMRVVPETTAQNLNYDMNGRAEEIAQIFRAFPDTHAVLYTTTGKGSLGVMLDRSDVHGAIETPSGESRSPRLRRSVASTAVACETWLMGLIPEFDPLGTRLREPIATSESGMDSFDLAGRVVDEVSQAGARARIDAKRDTWTGFGERETECLAAIVQEAQRGSLSEEDYRSLLDDLTEMAA